MTRYAFHSTKCIFSVYYHSPTPTTPSDILDRLSSQNPDMSCCIIQSVEPNVTLAEDGEIISAYRLELTYNYTADNFDNRRSVHQYDIYFELQRVRSTENDREWVFKMLRCPLLRGLHAVSTPPVCTFDDKQVLPMMTNPLVQSGSPLLSRPTTLLYLDRYDKKTDEVVVRSMIEILYRGSLPVQNQHDANQLFNVWRQQHQIPSTPRRLQGEVCKDAFVGKWPWINSNIPAAIPAWFNTYMGKPFDRSGNYRTLVVHGGGRLGKTRFIQSFGKHIYQRKTTSIQVIYDCIRDGDAKYIVLDAVPWPILLKNYHFLLSAQPDFTFKQGRIQMTTAQPLPVVVLNNDLPAKFYNPHGAKYWKGCLRYVEVEDKLFLKPPQEKVKEEEVKADVGGDVDAAEVAEVEEVDAMQAEVVDAAQVSPSTPANNMRLDITAALGDLTAVRYVEVEDMLFLRPPEGEKSEEMKADVEGDVDATKVARVEEVAAEVVAEMAEGAAEVIDAMQAEVVDPDQVSPSTPPDNMRPDITAALGDLRTQFPTARPIERVNEDSSVALLGWYIPNFFTKEEADAYLHALQHDITEHWLNRKDLTVAFRDMKGNILGVTRDKAVFCICSKLAPYLRSLYRYNSPELSQATPMSQARVVDSIRQTLVDRLHIFLNHCVTNWFRGKQLRNKLKGDRMGAHSDADCDFVEGSPILTATFCQPEGERVIQFTQHAHQGGMTAVSRKTGKRSQKKTVVKGSKTSFTAQHGSVYLINYAINHTQEDGSVWKHEVIERKGESGDRFGLTYRGIGTCWDIRTGEIVKVDGKHKQAVPLNLVDETGGPVTYKGPRWAPTDHPVQVQVHEEQTGKKQSAKRKRADSDSESE